MRRRNSTSISDEVPRKRAHIRPVGKGTTESFHGEIVTDLAHKQWRIGKAIGSGSFGEIYLASEVINESVKSSTEYVMKIERHDSGPLFVEMYCYFRAAKLEMIKEWLKMKNIVEIGMPHYVASGSHVINSEKYRFLILPRYGTDLDSIFKSKNNQFNIKTVLTVSIQILDILEYLHSKGYVHGDIKASNLLLNYDKRSGSSKPGKYGNCKLNYIRQSKVCGRCNTKHTPTKTEKNAEGGSRPQQANQVYLLDYGLSNRFRSRNGEHKEYCDDVRKAHAGTILFCSRDAHVGCTSRRSDLDNLAYNILYWLTGKLPWENEIADPDTVNSMKCDLMSDVNGFLCTFLGDSYPRWLYEYFTYIDQLNFDEEPDYDFCRKLFCRGLLEFGYKNDNFLDFDKAVSCDKIKKKFLIRKIKIQSENYRPSQIKSKVIYDRQPLGINSQVMLIRKPTLRSERNKCRKLRLKNEFNWAKLLSSNPEDILRQNNRVSKQEVLSRSRKSTECSDSEPSVLNIDLASLNPTYAMIDVFNRAQGRTNSTYQNTSNKGKGDCIDEHEGYTPAMKLVLYNKQKADQLLKLSQYEIEKNSTAKRMTRSRTRNQLAVAVKSKSIGLKTPKPIKHARSLILPPIRRSYRLRG